MPDKSLIQEEVSRKKIRAANGQALEVVQQVTCKVHIGRMEAEMLFYIVEDLTVDVILGVQFLMQNEITMDFRDRVVSGKTNRLQSDIPLILTRHANKPSGKVSLVQSSSTTGQNHGLRGNMGGEQVRHPEWSAHSGGAKEVEG